MIAPFGLRTKGTVGARVLPLAQAMAALGHRVRVVVPPWDDPATSSDLALKRPRTEWREGVELVFVPVRPGPQPVTIPARLVSETLDFRPAVIHVFKPKAFSGLAALLLAGRKKPFLLDTDDWEGTGGYNELSSYSFLQKRLFNWQERDLARRARAVTVASRTLQTQTWSFGVPPDRVLYLPNGISAHKYAGWQDPSLQEQTRKWRQRLGLVPQDLVLLAYTRFAEFKAERLLYITQSIIKRLPQEQAQRVKLLVVGAGFFGEERQFQEAAAQIGLAEHLVMTGTLKLSELPAVLRCGDIALYPFDDNLINRARSSAKFLDLLMAERPVVTEAVGELSQYLQDGQGGFLVPPGDLNAFVEAVEKLVEMTAEERTAFGRRGPARLEARFRWETLVEPLEELYFKATIQQQ